MLLLLHFFEVAQLAHLLSVGTPWSSSAETNPATGLVPPSRRAVRFLARWGEQAEALGWTARDLFGLHMPPERPHPSYSRLSRYDEIGLIWLLRGREVIALTEATAVIQGSTGAITIYRRHNKPVLGPLGDSLDDFI
jgi:hypothetical protein